MDNQTETGMSLMPSKTAGKNIMQQNVVNIVSCSKRSPLQTKYRCESKFIISK